MQARADKRYSMVAITLHWMMAVAILLMLASGLSFDTIEMDKSFKFQLYQWHKSLGVIVLWLVILRMIWRVIHAPPPLPGGISHFDAMASKIGHWGLYLFMFIMPLSGWTMVSSSSYGLPTIVFGLFEWPHLPYLHGNKTVSGWAHQTHEIIGYALLAFVFIHIAGVIKHYAMERINLLPRMGIGYIKKD